VIDRLECNPFAVAGFAGCRSVPPAARIARSRPAPPFSSASRPRLVDQRELPLVRRERFGVGIDRVDVCRTGIGVGTGGEIELGIGVSRTDRYDLEWRFAFGLESEQVRDRTIREAGDDLGAVVERVGDRQQVREVRPGVPERVAKRSVPVLPGVSPPRRGRDDRQRRVGDARVLAGAREHAAVVPSRSTSSDSVRGSKW